MTTRNRVTRAGIELHENIDATTNISGLMHSGYVFIAVNPQQAKGVKEIYWSEGTYMNHLCPVDDFIPMVAGVFASEEFFAQSPQELKHDGERQLTINSINDLVEITIEDVYENEGERYYGMMQINRNFLKDMVLEVFEGK